MNKWEYQRSANILAFLSSPEYQERKDALRSLCKILNEENIQWTLLCSSSLFFKGVVDDFNDYDILVSIEDAYKLETVLQKAGAKLEKDETQKGGYFSSAFYREGYFKGIHLDIDGDMRICTFKTSYFYPVKSSEIEYLTIDGNINIPLSPIEVNLILYGMMEGWQAKRRYKRELCREYLEGVGVTYSNILESALEQGLPPFLERIAKVLLTVSSD